MVDNGWIRRDVAGLAAERGIDAARGAFPAWCLAFIHEIDMDEALVHTDTAAGDAGGDGGLDGWWRDEENHDFHLWQCKWSQEDEKVFDRKPGVELADALRALLQPEDAGQRGALFSEIGSRLRRSLESEYDVVLNLGLAGELSGGAQAQLQSMVENMRDDLGIGVRLEVWGWQELQAEYERRHPTNETLKGKSVSIRLQSSAALNIDSSDPTLPEPWKAVVASLNAASLGDAAAEFGPKLFSLNVRYALGSNRRIKNLHRSLTDPEDNQYFWLYNNGITIICDGFELKNDEVPPVIRMENPQVVNGCQTLTAFKRRRGEFSETPSVLARIIKPPSGVDGEEKALLIAERTNSQNEVSSRDLKSNNPVQKNLAIAFDQLDTPWFYERKRGEWNGLSRQRKETYRVLPEDPWTGRNWRRIDMEKAGQSYRMLVEPSEAITKKRDMFDDDDVYSWVFRGRRSPDHYIFAFLLRTKFEAQWHHNQVGVLVDLIGPHAEESVFRRMLRAKGQMVSHSMALSRMLLQQDAPDLEAPELAGWKLEDAQTGLRFVEHFDPVAHQWLRLLWKAFKELLDRSDDDDQSFKKLLERPARQSLKELWTSVSEAASFLVGPDWRLKLRKSIIEQVTE